MIRERAKNKFTVSVVIMDCSRDRIGGKISSGKDMSGNFCSQGEGK